MLSVVDDRGRVSEVTNRIPHAQHWDIYRRACSERPELVEVMRQRIREGVESDRYLQGGGSIPNSTWLGSELLRSWEQTPEWNAFCGGSEDLSSALFGEIMWTVMCADRRNWYTMKTSNANPDREERVYFLPGAGAR